MRRSRQQRALLAGLGVLLLAALAAVAVLGALRGSRSSARRAAGPTLPTVLLRPRARAPKRVLPGQVSTGSIETGEQVQYVPGELLIKFKDGAAPTARQGVNAAFRSELHAAERLAGIGAEVLHVDHGQETGAALAALRRTPGVEYVERNVVLHGSTTTPNDKLWSTQWGALAINAPQAWDREKGSRRVVVAVLDTGIDTRHPDLRDATVPGHNFVNRSAPPSDDHGHGTAVAGVIGARTNNGLGQAGICWRCSLMSVKVLDARGAGDTATVAAGIVWAVDHGARVINMSLGAPASTRTLADAVSYAQRKGAILVAAAGNGGSETPTYPAAYPQVLGVAGTMPSGERYSWSNYGSWVALAAPGCNTSAWSAGSYANFCGTSSAAPLVSGLAALVLSAHPKASAAQVRNTIVNSARRLGSGIARYGLIDAARALGSGPAPQSPLPAAVRPLPEALATFRGTLGTIPWRLRRKLAAGPLRALLTFSGSQPLTLALVDSQGTTLSSVTGPSALPLAWTLGGSADDTFVVSGSAGSSFVLQVASRPFRAAAPRTTK